MKNRQRLDGPWVRIMMAGVFLGVGASACRRSEAPREAPGGVVSPAEAEPAGEASVRLIPEAESVVPGSRWVLGLEFQMPAGWHTYWSNPGETGMPPSVTWTLPDGVRFERLQFPTPEWFEEDGIVSFGFGDVVWLLAEFAAGDGVSGSVEVEAAIDWMICKDVCMPVRSTAAIRLPVAPTARPDAARRDDFARWRARLPREAAGWAFDVTRAGGELTVRVRPEDPRLATGASWDRVRLYPLAVGSTIPSDPLRWRLEDGLWETRVAAGPAAAVGGRFEAVLALEDDDGIAGWLLSAEIVE